MKKLITGTLATAAASPVLAHAEATVHLHRADGVIWLAVALYVGIAAVALFRGT